MKCRFILLYFLLLPALLLNAQPAAKKAGPAKKSNFQALTNGGKKVAGAKIAQPERHTNSLSDNQKMSPDGVQATKNVTGIWKGYFVQNSLSFIEDKYRFEVQVAEQDNHSLTAVTYSYKTTVFYGKADATGIFTAKSKNFLLKELRLVDLKLTDKNSGACLMTCYLDYNKLNKTETLSGAYTSVSVKDKSDCGNGKVFLEKSPVTDFYKEDFLVKRENELKNKAKVLANKASGKKSSLPPVAKIADPKKPLIKPGAEGDLITKQSSSKPDVKIASNPKKEVPAAPNTTILKVLPKPEVLKSRDNEVLKTLITAEKEFKIELYDNGEVDGDRISVYHNNELIVNNKELSGKPITFTVHTDVNVPVNEFVMVAENMGTIPPNTSLMVITAGTQRYELFVTSTDQKNAVVRVEYKPENMGKD